MNPDANLPSGRTRHAAPFEEANVAHVVVQTLQALDYNVADEKSFIKRAQHIEYGLDAEVEFAAIAAWLGRCSLMHRLDQKSYTSPGMHAHWRIPDLLAILHYRDVTLPLLIEVKTTALETLSFAPEYLEGLRHYADTLGLPLLIAWRPRRLGWWVLVQPEHAKSVNGKLVLDLNAFRNDLMGWVLGDFRIFPKKDVGFSIKFEQQGASTPTKNGETFKAKVVDACWQDATGSRTDLPPEGVLVTALSTSELVTERKDKELIQKWVTHGGITSAQSVLRASVGFSVGEGQRVHWSKVAEELESILSRGKLLADLSAHIGCCIQYIIFQEPQTKPAFIPKSWNDKRP